MALTLDAVVHTEPRLAKLLDSARALSGKAVGAPTEALYLEFRAAAAALVGWERAQSRGGPDWLFDSKAYDLVCQALYDALSGAIVEREAEAEMERGVEFHEQS